MRRDRRNIEEERLAATRCMYYSRPLDEDLGSHIIVYKPNLKHKSDADVIRDAKREAMGLRPDDYAERRHHQDRNQTATDEMVCTLSLFDAVGDEKMTFFPTYR